jgi:hypothetical protein
VICDRRFAHRFQNIGHVKMTTDSHGQNDRPEIASVPSLIKIGALPDHHHQFKSLLRLCGIGYFS